MGRFFLKIFKMILSDCLLITAQGHLSYNPFSERYLSASMAARQPAPAAVTACR